MHDPNLPVQQHRNISTEDLSLPLPAVPPPSTTTSSTSFQKISQPPIQILPTFPTTITPPKTTTTLPTNSVTKSEAITTAISSPPSTLPIPPVSPPAATITDDLEDFSDTSVQSVFKTEPYSRRDTESRKKSTSTDRASPTPSNSSHRKSVSFDLADPQYRTIYFDADQIQATPVRREPEVVSVFQRARSQERLLNDNYEVPVEVVVTKLKKGILRAPSPMLTSSNNSTLDRPPTQPPAEPSRPISHHLQTDRENPFRKEFFAEEESPPDEHHSPDQNIYEEIDFTRAKFRDSSDSDGYGDNRSLSDRDSKMLSRNNRPRSTYDSDTSVMSPIEEHTSSRYYSNEHLGGAGGESERRIPIKWPMHKSTGNLMTDRAAAAAKPPLPPKPSSALKYANISYKDGLISEEIRQSMQRIEEKFDAYAPLPPLPSPSPSPTSSTGFPKFKRHASVDRPSESPPPPPVNLATLPSRKKLNRFDADPTIIGIVPAKFDILPTARRVEFVSSENSAEHILVTESTHRELMLHENHIRNTRREAEQPKFNVPVRQAPPPPSPGTPPVFSPLPPPPPLTPPILLRQPPPPPPPFSSSPFFPPTQILPVQYSHLPMPQQPTGYFQQHPTATQFTYQKPSMPPPPPPPPINNTTIHHHHVGGYSVGGTMPPPPPPPQNPTQPPSSASYMVSDVLGPNSYNMQHHQQPFPSMHQQPLFVNTDTNWSQYYQQQQQLAHQQYQRQYLQEVDYQLQQQQQLQHKKYQLQLQHQISVSSSSASSNANATSASRVKQFNRNNHFVVPSSPTPSNSSSRSESSSITSPPILGKQTSV